MDATSTLFSAATRRKRTSTGQRLSFELSDLQLPACPTRQPLLCLDCSLSAMIELWCSAAVFDGPLRCTVHVVVVAATSVDHHSFSTLSCLNNSFSLSKKYILTCPFWKLMNSILNVI